MKYCFSCLKSRRSKKTNRNHAASAISSNGSKAPGLTLFTLWCADTKKQKATYVNKEKEIIELYRRQINAQSFTFRELATATKNFRKECLLGEGRFGRVYKGTLKSTGQVVAVKQLDRNSVQGKKEFLEEVLRLSLLHHPNLVNLVGYCADGDQRLLVYEYMRGGTVEDGLTDLTEDKKPLDWATRIKIALGAARGLEFLHIEAKPPVIYHDLQAANILLDENFKPKLSIFGLAKLGPVGDDNQFSTRVIETYGYTAPEYAETCQVTMKSDVYSFGVILLELITGRRVIDNTRPAEEQNLISWAEPIFKDPKRFPDLVDPHLKRRIPERSLNQAVAVAAMCLQDEPSTRPLMSDVVTILSFLNGNEQGNFVQDSKHWANHEDEEISKRESSDCPGISEGSKGKSLISSRENSKRGSKSPNNSDNRSVDKSFSSRSFATNKKLQDGNAPSYTESRWKSNGVSVNSCQNGSKKLQKSSNLKRIRKYYWLSKKQTKKTFSLAKQMSTRIWRYWFKSKKHEKLKDKTFSSRHKNFRKSHKILDDTATSTRSRMSKDALCEVTLLHP